MTNKTKPSKALKDKYARYKTLNKFAKNYERKLERHLKKFPNDKAAEKALLATPKYKTKPQNKLGWVKKTALQNPAALRKEDAVVSAQIAKFSAKSKTVCTKTVSKNIKLNPFSCLESIKSVLPRFEQPTTGKRKSK